jgi:hypothetical protein
MKDVPIKEAAARCCVHPATLKRWIRGLGYNMPRLGRGRYTLLVPEWMVQKMIAQRSPRIASVGVSRVQEV